MFGDLDKTMQEARIRWKEIEEGYEDIKSRMTSGKGMDEASLAHLLVLVIDHLRPMNPSQDQLDEATKGIAELLESLGRKK